jgi:hypothetical protein
MAHDLSLELGSRSCGKTPVGVSEKNSVALDLIMPASRERSTAPAVLDLAIWKIMPELPGFARPFNGTRLGGGVRVPVFTTGVGR